MLTDAPTPDVDLAGVEFSALPSGLHLVSDDVVYFTSQSGHPGVCIFKRRATAAAGQRGFRLSSLGILLAKSTRPRPWRHVADLKNLIMVLYSQSEDVDLLVDVDQDFWKAAKEFFQQRRVQAPDLGGGGDWMGWSYELDGPDKDLARSNPITHLPHLLRILGPSSLTLYKHVLGRQRILVYTLPPVQPACLLAQVACDLAFDLIPPSSSTTSTTLDNESVEAQQARLPRGKARDGIQNLGMVTLSDLDRLRHAGDAGRGFIACTTDAIFLEKPAYFDLVINLATSTPSRTSRPTLYVSKTADNGPDKPLSYRLSAVRFAWSDVRLWNELDRLLALDSPEQEHEHDHHCCAPSSPDPKSKGGAAASWSDASWRVYEDVCLVCASLWMGVGSWKSNSTMSYSTASSGGNVGAMSNWGSAQQEGDQDWSMGGNHYVRTLGMGIEGRRASEGGAGRRRESSSYSTHSSPPTATSSTFPLFDKQRTEEEAQERREEAEERRYKQILTTLALLQTFHANTCFQLTQLKRVLGIQSSPSSSPDQPGTVCISAKDMAAFELSALSGMDARYLGWLVDEYGGGAQLVIKKGWRDVLGVMLGYY